MLLYVQEVLHIFLQWKLDKTSWVYSKIKPSKGNVRIQI